MRLVKLLILAIPVVFLLSCSGGGDNSPVSNKETEKNTKEAKLQDEEAVTTREVLPESDVDSVSHVALTCERLKDSACVQQILNSLLAEYQTVKEKPSRVALGREGVVYAQEVSAKKKTHVKYGESNIFPRFDLFYYRYSTHEEAVAGINALLSALSEDLGGGKKLEFGKPFHAVKTPPLFLVLEKNVIALLRYPCEHIGNDWTPVEKAIISGISGDGKPEKIMKIGCGGPLSWE
ncbi:MAG: hypothetical protein KKA07_00690 [Bacteroidetes bacterium]|nr:hypothetical protein [Bacteroidota bacterium]MBU1717567.1 hypothetical protein [Bacteroidota bacterium]